MRSFGEGVTSWGVIAMLAPFALALVAYLAVFLFTRPGATGDEPHYLLVAESIAYDRDVVAYERLRKSGSDIPNLSLRAP